MTTNAIWLFDSTCVLCDRAVRYTLRHEKVASIKFISIQSEQGRKLVAEHGIDPEDSSSFLFIENTISHAKSDGVIKLSKHRNGSAGVIRLFRFAPKFIRDAAYDLIDRNRYSLFGRKDQYFVPTDENIERFVL